MLEASSIHHKDLLGREIRYGHIIAGLTGYGIKIGTVINSGVLTEALMIKTADGIEYIISSINNVLVDKKDYFMYLLTREIP